MPRNGFSPCNTAEDATARIPCEAGEMPDGLVPDIVVVAGGLSQQSVCMRGRRHARYVS